MNTLRPTVSLVIIASVVLVSVAAWAQPRLMSALILNPYRVRQRFELHRLLTAGWLHADGMHLLFNMLTLYFFADQVVRALGPLPFLFLYLSAVIAAHVPTTLRHMNNPKYNSLGASGAVAAVTFSAVLLYPGMKLAMFFIPIPLPGMVYAVGYLAYSAWQSRQSRGGVNHDAHFAGAVYGALLTYVYEPERVMNTLRHPF